MKDTSFIINTSRGGIIEENALYYALKNKLISGAALDVYLDEPKPFKKLCQIRNLICTPHIAGNSIESVKGMGMASIDHLVKYFTK